MTHIVACKAATQHERQLAAKRGACQVLGESALDAQPDGPHTALQSIARHQRTPAEEAEFADCYRHYLDALPERLRKYAELHVAGATNAEIAAHEGVVERTVERKLALIRGRWQEMATSESAS